MYVGNSNVANWDSQINEIYGTSAGCKVGKQLEVVNNGVGNIQEFYDELEHGIIEMMSVQLEHQINLCCYLSCTHF